MSTPKKPQVHDERASLGEWFWKAIASVTCAGVSVMHEHSQVREQEAECQEVGA